MSMPKVAVIIPCWNAEKWVAKAIQSALDQDYRPLEVIVIDDGSTDGSLDVIRSFGDRIRWETGPNRGAPAARNRGMALTDAEFVLFLDADDYIMPGALDTLVNAGDAADLVVGRFRLDHAGEQIDAPYCLPSSLDVDALADWMIDKHINPCAMLWRRDILQEIGGWNVLVRKCQDRDLAVRALIRGARVSTVPEVCGVYVQHASPSRISHSKGRGLCEHQLEVFVDLMAAARERGLNFDRSFGLRFYRIAIEAFNGGWHDVGRRALRLAREAGFRGHVGSRAHRIASTLVGVENKIRLRNSLRFAG